MKALVDTLAGAISVIVKLRQRFVTSSGLQPSLGTVASTGNVGRTAPDRDRSVSSSGGCWGGCCAVQVVCQECSNPGHGGKTGGRQ